MNDAISDKVKKLLRLAACKAATPAEAAAALNRAMELIGRHHIDIASLDLDEDTERIVCERIKVGQRVSFIKRRCADILINYFKVRGIWDRDCLAVVGFEHDVTMAGYVFHFLVGACTRSVAQFAKDEKAARRRTTANKKKNYVQGWIYGVVTNLRKPDLAHAALGDSRTSIVLSARSARVDAEFQELFPPENLRKLTVQEPRTNHHVINRGFRDGMNTSIHQPLTNAQQGTLLLT